MTNIQPTRSNRKEQKKSKQHFLLKLIGQQTAVFFKPKVQTYEDCHFWGRTCQAITLSVSSCQCAAHRQSFWHRSSCGSQQPELKPGNYVWSPALANASLSLSQFQDYTLYVARLRQSLAGGTLPGRCCFSTAMSMF